MIEKNLSAADLEAIYDRMANAIDQAGEEKTTLFLSKLALVLANLVGKQSCVEQAIEGALRDL